jgi:CheY-like chemotaxis protein
LLTIINDILDFSKIEAGKLALEDVEMSLKETIEDVGRLLGLQVQEKGLTLVTHLDPALPRFVRGDPVRLRQILLNLIGNAVKFTPAGEVTVDARVVERDPQAVLVRCEVRDTGIGIAPDRLVTLFAPFAQADASTTRRFGGTGLGLSIVRRLVELMGGTVGATSEPGKGSSFWFALRLPTSEKEHGIADSIAAAITGGRGRILVADDNAVNRKVVTRLLEKLGFHADAVADGSAAVAQWACGNYDLILMDCQMPSLDGYEATREIRRREGGARHLPIVALTADAMNGADRACFDAGMDAYLTKPIDRRMLEETLRRLMRLEIPAAAAK